MFLKRFLLCIVFLYFFIQSSSALQAKQVTFKGTAVDFQGKPVAGAKVKLYKEDYSRVIYLFSLPEALDTSTNDDGTFTFNKNTQGDNYLYGYVLVEKEGLAIDCTYWVMDENKEFEFTLKQPEELTGTVVDENNEPVSDAKVSILVLTIGEEKASYGEYLHTLGAYVAPNILNTKTDKDGKFTFKNLPADSRVEFLVQKKGKAAFCDFKRETYPEEPLRYSPEQKSIKIVMSPESIIEGIAVDINSKKGVSGATLILKQNQNEAVFGQDFIISGEDGKFKINNLASGSYRLLYATSNEKVAEWVARPVDVVLETGQIKNDLKVELSKGGLLEAHFSDAGNNKSLEGVSVTFHNEQNGQSYSGKSDKDGIAKTRLLPGVYESPFAYKDGYSTLDLQTSLNIEEGMTKSLGWQLDPMRKASGVVRDEIGKPLKGVKLIVLPGGYGRDVESDEEGRFNISWDTGMFSDEQENPLLVCRYEESNLAKAVVLKGSAENLDVKLEPGITLTGKISDPNNKGISIASIRIMLKQTRGYSTIESNDSTKMDREGHFQIKAIPAGYSYQITANAVGYGSLEKIVNADDSIDNKLDSGVFALALANLSVSGVIVDTEGNPIPNAKIESNNYRNGQPENLNTQADSQGKFTLKGVCEGSVDIRVSANINGKSVSARASADGGMSDIKIVAYERGEYNTQRFNNKSYERILKAGGKIIAGIVVDEKNIPVAGVPVGVNCIKREREDAPGKFMWTYSSYENLSGTTDKEGRFAIELEEDAQYDLIFSPLNYAAELVYDIPSGKKDLKVILSKGGTILGQLVRMEGNKKVPIDNVEVKLEHESRASYTYLGFDREQTTRTDSQGRFKFEHIQTMIKPHETMAEYIPRVWQIVYGDNKKTFAFYEGKVINNFEMVIENEQSGTKILVGKAIPDFNGIKIDFDKEKAKNKKLLICFFDIEQRPSRSAILELSQKASQLKEKDIEVIAIQASKTDKNSFNDWIKEYNINIPMGFIEDNSEQTRFNWGVKALPWLILTDKEHVVTDEGFSSSELEEKIKN